MKKRLFLVLPVLLVLLMLAGPGVTLAQETFSFSNQYSYVDETKILRVLGEVRNDGDKPVKEILVTASFYDS
ncbi:MAG TPA: hypothetical protein VJP79_11220, partial [Nitrososphaera sp.]|nr:hypothetical protein [Nitrososphaera sp.]